MLSLSLSLSQQFKSPVHELSCHHSPSQHSRFTMHDSRFTLRAMHAMRCTHEHDSRVINDEHMLWGGGAVSHSPALVKLTLTTLTTVVVGAQVQAHGPPPPTPRLRPSDSSCPFPHTRFPRCDCIRYSYSYSNHSQLVRACARVCVEQLTIGWKEAFFAAGALVLTYGTFFRHTIQTQSLYHFISSRLALAFALATAGGAAACC